MSKDDLISELQKENLSLKEKLLQKKRDCQEWEAEYKELKKLLLEKTDSDRNVAEQAGEIQSSQSTDESTDETAANENSASQGSKRERWEFPELFFRFVDRLIS